MYFKATTEKEKNEWMEAFRISKQSNISTLFKGDTINIPTCSYL